MANQARLPAIGLPGHGRNVDWNKHKGRLMRFYLQVLAFVKSEKNIMSPTGPHAHVFVQHKHILRLLRLIKTYSTQLTRNENFEGVKLNLPSLDDKGVIYVIFFQRKGETRLYVGQTKNSAFCRYQGHCNDANNTNLHPRSLHNFIRQNGSIQDCYILPIMRIPCDSDVENGFFPPIFRGYAADELETRWIRRLNTHYRLGHGFNLKMPNKVPAGVHYCFMQLPFWDPAAYVTSMARNPYIPYQRLGNNLHLVSLQTEFQLEPNEYRTTHLSRNYVRRIRFLLGFLQQHGAVGVVNHLMQTTYGMQMRLKHILRMFFLLTRTPLNVDTTPPNPHFSEQKQALLAELLLNVVNNISTSPPTREKKTCLMVYYYDSQAYDIINLPGIFEDANVVAALPAALRRKINPRVVAKHKLPLRCQLLNHNTFYNNATYEDLLQDYEVSATAGCDCKTRFLVFCPPGHDHVVTADPKLIEAVVGPDFGKAFSLSMSHRPARHRVLTASLKASHLADIEIALNKYYEKLSASFSQPIVIFQPQKHSILNLAKERLDAVADGTLLVPSTAPYIPRNLKADCVTLQNRFVVTEVDKLPNTAGFVCKHYVAQKIIDDLGATNAFSGRPVFQFKPDISAEQAVNEILEATSSLNIKIPPRPAPPEFAEGLSQPVPVTGPAPFYRLPKYALTIKLHKDPIGFRYLTLAYHTAGTPMAVKLNVVLNALGEKIGDLWKRELDRIRPNEKKNMASLQHLIITSSSDIPDFLFQHDKRCRSRSFHAAPVHMETFDITRLYTNLDQEDLIAKLTELIHELWPVGECLKVSGLVFEWVPVAMAIAASTRRSSAPIFTKADAIKLLQCSVRLSYIQVATRVHQQGDGLPMGHNAAVNLANLYLFCYELKFLRQLATCLDRSQATPTSFTTLACEKRAFALVLLVALSKSKRYIDDILRIAGTVLASLGTTEDQHSIYGFHGLYPPTLQLEKTDDGFSVDFLDVTILHSSPTVYNTATGAVQPAGYLVTHLFDKRRGPRYANIDFAKFPEVFSDLAAGSKYGILTSQFRRYNRIITDFGNFVAEMAFLLFFMVKVKNYNQKKLLRLLKNCCFSDATNSYGQPSQENLRRTIESTFFCLLRLFSASQRAAKDQNWGRL
ncbi:hypothetical protein NADE_007717 [Nannochloris sp. 'desiccata']|nr:hypothetical protein NADE_007717 [Chlorella desiccata (nom. nud.)]